MLHPSLSRALAKSSKAERVKMSLLPDEIKCSFLTLTPFVCFLKMTKKIAVGVYATTNYRIGTNYFENLYPIFRDCTYLVML